jgi:hypothetical protein
VERQIAGLSAPRSPSELAKLAVLGIRWPGLLSTLATQVVGGRTVYELLEDPDTDYTTVEATLRDAGLTAATVARLTVSELRDFITAPPIVGAGVHGYL